MKYNELCGNCSKEVEIEMDKLEMVFKCPQCGEYIVLCSMCPTDYEGCNKCKYIDIANKLSNENINRIIIKVNGGMVEDVYTNLPLNNLCVEVLDYDAEENDGDGDTCDINRRLEKVIEEEKLEEITL